MTVDLFKKSALINILLVLSQERFSEKNATVLFPHYQQIEKIDVCEQESGFSQDAESMRDLILDFSASRTEK